MGDSHRKVTVSLPQDLVEYADRLARETSTSRSAVIADLLEWRRARARDALAREGYAFYGDEAEEFAGSSAPMVAEALDDDDSAW
jgi:metal-responsive CopG/Arc/MetJ family transcriptional regulator